MKIDDKWEHNDLPTGLKFSVHKGKNLDVLHIEFTGKSSKVTNRDLYFDKDGNFDGGGTSVDQKCPVKDSSDNSKN